MKKSTLIMAIILVAAVVLCSCEKLMTKKSENPQKIMSTGTEITVQRESPATSIPAVTDQIATSVSVITSAPPVTSNSTSISSSSGNTHHIAQNKYTALNYSEQKGIWISYIEDAELLRGKTEAEFRKNLEAAFTNIKSLGCNTVYVHVRASSDAYYPSEFFPWSKNCTGTLGKAPAYDPLEIMIDEAHKKGLSFHAWINPMRGPLMTEISAYADSYPIKKWFNDSTKNGKYISIVGDNFYLNPAYPEVRQLISDGVKEIVAKYKVDGIHIDDYFYPTTNESFDAEAFKASGAGNLADWRRANVNSMVSEIYMSVKSINPKAVFGVSPAGNLSNDYNTLYADVKKWCSEAGYIDYIVPQIYWGFDKSQTLPFEKCSSDWNDIIKIPSVKLIFGLAPYKIGNASFDWATGEKIISRQISYSKTLKNYSGVALYRYDSLFNPAEAVKAKVNAELQAIIEVLNK